MGKIGMNFSSWHDFITMGHYAYYVWPAYGIGFAVIGANLVSAIRYYRRMKNHIMRHQHAPHS